MKFNVLLEISMIYEFELYLLETLQFSTIVYHPYKYLTKLVKDGVLSLPDDSIITSAWCVINDSYKWDTSLYYPPHLIALSAVYFSSALATQGKINNPNHSDTMEYLSTWFSQLTVDFQAIVDIVQGWIYMYDRWRSQGKDGGSQNILEIIDLLRKT